MADRFLTDEQRTAIEAYLLSDLPEADSATTFRAVREFNKSIGVYSASLDFLRWVLAADDMLLTARADGVREGVERSMVEVQRLERESALHRERAGRDLNAREKCERDMDAYSHASAVLRVLMERTTPPATGATEGADADAIVPGFTESLRLSCEALDERQQRLAQTIGATPPRTLTDAERMAVVTAIGACEWHRLNAAHGNDGAERDEWARTAATLRGLLARDWGTA